MVKPVKSLNSGKTVYMNKEDFVPSLHEAAHTLKRDPNVVSVKLFGSLVRGNYAPGSDADILIVLKKDARRMIDRIPGFLDFFDDVFIPIDIFPYTEEEIENMKKTGNSFISEMLQYGIELS